MLQPFESIMPVITNPHFNANKPLPLEVVNKVRLDCPHLFQSSLEMLPTSATAE